MSECGEDGGIHLVTVGVSRLGQHFLGNFGKFNETGISLEDFSEDFLSLIEYVNGILIVLSLLVGSLLLNSSHLSNDGLVFFIGEDLGLSNFEFVL